LVEADFLFTVAEVAAAFAGFSTLVVVVAQRSRNVRGELATAKLTNMLRLSLLVILFSLVPYLPLYFGASEIKAWRISSGLFAFLWLVYFLDCLRRAVPTRFHGFGLVNKINFFGVEGLAILALVAGAFGAWRSHTGFVYLSSLLAMLYISGWLFLQQVVEISRDEPAD
jgi:hypothetical protein